MARLIDHTVLKAETTREQVDRLCDEALAHNFRAVCVNPVWVAHCASRLKSGTTDVAAVVGFPLGASLPESKAFEARCAVEHGALEVDMVINLAALRAGDERGAASDIAAVVKAAKSANADALVKVILETGALSDAQIELGCAAARQAGADYVKTSTGFHSAGGATVEHVALLREHAGGMKVKAAGGIRDLATAIAMIEAGADRLGMSSGVAVVEAMPA